MENETEAMEPVIIDEPVIDCGLWSRWVDVKDRVFVIVDRWEPQIWKGRFCSTRFKLLHVEAEYCREVTREEFEGYVRSGALVRKG